MFYGNLLGHLLPHINCSHLPSPTDSYFLHFNLFYFLSKLNSVLPCDPISASLTALLLRLCLPEPVSNLWRLTAYETNPLSLVLILNPDVCRGRVFWLYLFQGILSLEKRCENRTEECSTHWYAYLVSVLKWGR